MIQMADQYYSNIKQNKVYQKKTIRAAHIYVRSIILQRIAPATNTAIKYRYFSKMLAELIDSWLI
jgi:hypothetical protein